jgi:tungstate transport system ATP-binding protein
MPEDGMQRRLGGVGTAVRSVLPIRGEGLTLARGNRTILQGIDLELHGGGTLVMMGPNGAGKSVLVRVLAGLLLPTTGRVTWAGTPPDRQRAQGIGFVFQRPVLLRRSAIANVEYALAVAGVPRAERADRAQAALARARLEHLAHSPARVLSGGEQQRLSIARTLATDPQILILDEPTANLDPAATTAIESLITAVREAQVGVVLITHDVGQARRMADEIVFLHHGRIVERAPREEFLNQPRSPAAQAFLRGDIVL